MGNSGERKRPAMGQDFTLRKWVGTAFDTAWLVELALNAD